MNDEERQREVTEETGEQGILKDEEGKTLEEETQEIPENEN
jgi:hypothetical protein